eukprot:PLAT9141.1.p1 GENE.PLAT9141.1~~PLAT9141.1.p1  ORF type:complete len:1178 (+),score=562.90 PLAT9141.1:1-3534(+)
MEESSLALHLSAAALVSTHIIWSLLSFNGRWPALRRLVLCYAAMVACILGDCQLLYATSLFLTLLSQLGSFPWSSRWLPRSELPSDDLDAYGFSTVQHREKDMADGCCEQLPDELVERVQSFLSAEDLSRSMASCKRLWRIGSGDRLWDALRWRVMARRRTDASSRVSYIYTLLTNRDPTYESRLRMGALQRLYSRLERVRAGYIAVYWLQLLVTWLLFDKLPAPLSPLPSLLPLQLPSDQLTMAGMLGHRPWLDLLLPPLLGVCSYFWSSGSTPFRGWQMARLVMAYLLTALAWLLQTRLFMLTAMFGFLSFFQESLRRKRGLANMRSRLAVALSLFAISLLLKDSIPWFASLAYIIPYNIIVHKAYHKHSRWLVGRTREEREQARRQGVIAEAVKMHRDQMLVAVLLLLATLPLRLLRIHFPIIFNFDSSFLPVLFAALATVLRASVPPPATVITPLYLCWLLVLQVFSVVLQHRLLLWTAALCVFACHGESPGDRPRIRLALYKFVMALQLLIAAGLLDSLLTFVIAIVPYVYACEHLRRELLDRPTLHSFIKGGSALVLLVLPRALSMLRDLQLHAPLLPEGHIARWLPMVDIAALHSVLARLSTGAGVSTVTSVFHWASISSVVRLVGLVQLMSFFFKFSGGLRERDAAFIMQHAQLSQARILRACFALLLLPLSVLLNEQHLLSPFAAAAIVAWLLDDFGRCDRVKRLVLRSAEQRQQRRATLRRGRLRRLAVATAFFLAVHLPRDNVAFVIAVLSLWVTVLVGFPRMQRVEHYTARSLRNAQLLQLLYACIGGAILWASQSLLPRLDLQQLQPMELFGCSSRDSALIAGTVIVASYLLSVDELDKASRPWLLWAPLRPIAAAALLWVANNWLRSSATRSFLLLVNVARAGIFCFALLPRPHVCRHVDPPSRPLTASLRLTVQLAALLALQIQARSLLDGMTFIVCTVCLSWLSLLRYPWKLPSVVAWRSKALTAVVAVLQMELSARTNLVVPLPDLLGGAAPVSSLQLFGVAGVLIYCADGFSFLARSNRAGQSALRSVCAQHLHAGLLFAYYLMHLHIQTRQVWLLVAVLVYAALYTTLLMLNFGNMEAEPLYVVACVSMIYASTLVASQTLLALGALGLVAFLTYLSRRVFHNNVMFPFALSLLGLAIIAGAVMFQKHRDVLFAGSLV